VPFPVQYLDALSESSRTSSFNSVSSSFNSAWPSSNNTSHSHSELDSARSHSHSHSEMDSAIGRSFSHSHSQVDSSYRPDQSQLSHASQSSNTVNTREPDMSSMVSHGSSYTFDSTTRSKSDVSMTCDSRSSFRMQTSHLPNAMPEASASSSSNSAYESMDTSSPEQGKKKRSKGLLKAIFGRKTTS